MPSSGVQTCALRSEEHTSELQSHDNLVCRLLLEKNSMRPARRACPRRAGRAAARLRRDVRAPGRLRRTAVFFLMMRRPPRSPLFPSPTLFRSDEFNTGGPAGCVAYWDVEDVDAVVAVSLDRKSTRLNSSHTIIPEAAFCFK